MANTSWKNIATDPPGSGAAGPAEFRNAQGKRKAGFLTISGTRPPQESETEEQPVFVVQVEEPPHVNEYPLSDFKDWRPVAANE